MNEPLDSSERQPQASSNYKRIIGMNIAILAFYTFYIFISDGNEGALIDAFFIAFHVGVCIILGIILTLVSNLDEAKGFFLSALLVLIIGFGTCGLGLTL